MDYKRLERNNYTLHLINTSRFRTINVEVFFSNMYNRKDKIYYTFLEYLLSNTSKKYNTRLKMNIKREDLYDLNMWCSYFTIGKNQTFSLNASIINPKYVDDSLYDELFDYLNELLFNPNVKNNKFDEKEYDFTLDGIINSVKKFNDDNKSYALSEFYKYFYDKTLVKNTSYEKERVYKKIKNEDVYSFYKTLFLKNRIDVFVIGDYSEDVVIKKADKLFENIVSKKNKKVNLYFDSKLKSNICKIKEIKNYNQSILIIGYKFKDLTEYEYRYVLPIYNMMLGGASITNSILFTNVREKNSLCYYVGSYASRFSSSLIIEAQINKSNYDKTLKLIKENVKIDENVEGIDDLFLSSKESFNIALNDYYDNPYKIVERYYLSLFDNILDVEETRKIINNLDINDIYKLSNKIKLDTIYFLEGNKDE